MTRHDALGLAAAAITTTAFFPQALKIHRSRQARDISLPGWSLFAVGLALWLVYGIGTEAMPVIVANAAGLAVSIWILTMKIRFDRKPAPDDKAEAGSTPQT